MGTNIKTYSLSFAVSIATFNELSGYDRGVLVRDFSDFMRAKGAELSFLASQVELVSKLENENVQET